MFAMVMTIWLLSNSNEGSFMSEHGINVDSIN
jgi:hypothetical protein